MAEGDTILRAARRIEAAISGGPVEASAPNPRGRAARVERLDGLALERAGAHGKHLLLHFGALVLHSHLGMSGSWHTYRQGEPWRKPTTFAWAVLATERAEAVQFGGPTLRLLRAEAVARDPVLTRLGPDVLAPDFDAALIARSLATVPDRALGDALLDQHLVAGIGNIFKSEACFAAHLDPWQRVGDLPEEQLTHVAQAAHDLMQAAVDEGRGDRGVYKRAGRPCPRCGTELRSRGQGDANRTTYWCPSCQVAANRRS
ncbi:MAG TPA: DNA-formamidopyrimidine glycosylase family protein [Solirubrobacterales bacterium]|nr:DNA-formamidopyrimidine glycosylase family protein [Solirubrobacterales bacterium]